MTDRKVKIESRNDKFTTRIKSEITEEIPADDNAFLTKTMRIHGYDVLDLMEHYDYQDIFYLIFKRELPNPEQKQLLRLLSVFLINLGPRHASARAAANAGVGRTDVNHILPIAVMAMGGSYGGSKEVEDSMRFILKNADSPADNVAKTTLEQTPEETNQDWIIAPGFGTDFGGQSPLLHQVKNKLLAVNIPNKYLSWAEQFVRNLPAEKHCGWRLAGVVAATLLDLGFPARQGAGIFQMLASPGAYAHGIQFADKAITEIPFLNDEFYEIKND